MNATDSPLPQIVPTDSAVSSDPYFVPLVLLVVLVVLVVFVVVVLA